MGRPPTPGRPAPPPPIPAEGRTAVQPPPQNLGGGGEPQRAGGGALRGLGGEGPESALRHIKPGVRAAGAYTLRHHEPRIKLNQNESPFDLPAELKERILAQAADRPWNRYPPFVPERFIGAVAEATGWPAEGILVANGSNELIQAILAVTAAPDIPVVIAEPTFTLYRLLTQVGGGEVVAVPLDAELRFDVEAIIRAAQESRAALIVLCTPNNPTGSVLSREEIERIHDATESLVVLDQAYVEFGGYDALPLLAGRPRLLVLRTFSKAMAMAGLRAGYLLADPALAREIAKGKLPYNLNFFSEIAAAEVLRARDVLQAQVAFIVEQRDCILRRLGRLPGLRLFLSEANFVLFRVESPRITHEQLFERLLSEHGILVRDVSKYPMLAGCLRVTAGTPEETDAFSDAMAAILKGG